MLNPQPIRRYMLLTLALCLLMLGGHVRAQDATPEATPLPSLAEQVGFDDPKLDEFEAEWSEWPLVLRDQLSFSAYEHHYLLLAISTADVDSSERGCPDGFGMVLLYQMDNAKPEFVWSDSYFLNYNLSYKPYIDTYEIDQGYGLSSGMPVPGDWNKDGNIEFAVHGSGCDISWADNLYFIYQLLPDNQVVSALAGKLPGDNIVSGIKRTPDGTILLEVQDISGQGTMGFPPIDGPIRKRFFTWQAGKLVDVSSTRSYDYYDGVIGNNVLYVTTKTVDSDRQFSAEFFAVSLLEILQSYESLDQREAGWKLVQNLVAQARSDGRLPEGTYVDTVFMPTMQRLYNDKLPFVPPDYAYSNHKPGDYYLSSSDDVQP